MTDFKECLHKFISKTSELTIKLEDKIKKVENHRQNCNIAKTTGTTIGGLGAAAATAGVILAPFTYGISLALTAGGIAGTVAGTATNVVTDMVDKSTTKDFMKEIRSIVEEHQEASKNLNAILEYISKIVEALKTKGMEETEAILKTFIYMSKGHNLSNIEDFKLAIHKIYAIKMAVGITLDVMLTTLKCANIIIKTSAPELLTISTILRLTSAGARTTLKIAGAAVSWVGVVLDVVDLVRGWNNDHPTIPVIRELIDVLNSQKEQMEQFLNFYTAVEVYDKITKVIERKDSPGIRNNMDEKDMIEENNLLMGGSFNVEKLQDPGPYLEYDSICPLLNKGDLIEINRVGAFRETLFQHWVIFEKIDDYGVWCFHATGDFNLNDAGAFLKTNVHIRYEPLLKILNWFGKTSLCRINNQEYAAQQKLLETGRVMPDIDQVFKSLHERKEEAVKYNLRCFNCEHYATLWKYGVAWSAQAEVFKSWLFGSCQNYEYLSNDQNEVNFEINETYSMLKASADIPGVPDIPKEWDWRQYGIIITPIEDQGKCNSCWAFAAATVLESHNNKRLIAEGKFDKTKPVTVSVQNLIDCSSSKEFGNRGCNGGMHWKAWSYVAVNGGVNTTESYPYEAKKGKCRYKVENKADVVVDVSKPFKRVKTGDEDLVNAIYNYGPLAVSVHFNGCMDKYRCGIFDGQNPKKPLDHAMVAVGYHPDYFILRNSHGLEFGEDGYIRIRRKVDHCGVIQKASYPILPNAVETSKMKDKLVLQKQSI